MTRLKQMPGVSLAARDLEEVERILEREVRSEVRLVVAVSRHILKSGGKRFRPLLTVLSGRLAGLRRRKELLNYAAAMELAHTSTLLHDDVIDEADLRRGRISANRAFGNAPSIIIGDYLLFKSFELMLKGRRQRVMDFMTRVAVEMAEGEAYQLMQKSKVDLTLAQYERIIRSKTALLIDASCRIPAIAADAGKKHEQALGEFGYRLGLAFQITDDVLDYAAGEKQWGKAVGKDFMEGKTTLPLIIAHQRADREEKLKIKEMFKKKKRTLADYRRLMTIMQRTDALAAARSQAGEEVEKAKKALEAFPASPPRKALQELADFVVARSF